MPKKTLDEEQDFEKESKMTEPRLNLFELLREKTPDEMEQLIRTGMRRENLEAATTALELLERTRPDRLFGELFNKIDESTRIMLLLDYFISNQPVIEKFFQLADVTLEDVLTTYKKKLGDKELAKKQSIVGAKLQELVERLFKTTERTLSI